MSIKSQKSLYEECSEIFERSYSVRSYSDESLSCDDDDECLARELMARLTPAALSKLRRAFRRSKERKEAADIDRRVEAVMRAAAAEEGIEFAVSAAPPSDPLWLDEAGFVAAIDNIFGHHKYSTHASKLFHLLDPFGTGAARWRQLVKRLVAAGARRTGTRADCWPPLVQGDLARMEHCKRETLVKLVSIERAESFCYVAVSRGGRVGVYSGGLRLMHSYEVFYHRSGLSRRVKNCWLTDVVFLPDVQCLIFAASDRSLTVYDAATLAHNLTFCITGLPNITTCMAYTPTRAGVSELALGSERGEIVRLRFLQPKVSLFYAKSPDHVNYYFWMELAAPPHTSYLSIHTWRRVHTRSIRRLTYLKEGDYLVSCSHDSTASVRIRHVAGKIDDYVFKVQRGVSCFHLVPSLHLLAAGSADGCVRLWETTQVAPFATLTAPGLAAVLDVAVIASREIIVAYCSNCWLHIWDMYEECLLQTIKLKFPFLGVLGKKVEFGTYCIHPGPARKPPSEEQPQQETSVLETSSRRGSSVYQGSTGGLILQLEDAEASRPVEEDVEYIRFNRSELLLSCCDYVVCVELSGGEGGARGELLAPPGDTLRARRPSFWDLPDDVFRAPALSPKPPPLPLPATPQLGTIPSNQLLSPARAENPLHDLDTLLKNAGLEGILEKDFVLMQGLKHDLNKKLADMKVNMDLMCGAVSMGGAYLALKCSEPSPLPPVDDKMEQYKRVIALFPEVSLTGTPTVSNTSTPRKRTSTLLCVPGTGRRHNSTSSRD